MRILLGTAALTLMTGAGCLPHKPVPTKTERAGGLISQVHDKVDEAVIMQTMHDLHLLMETSSTIDGRMLTPDEVKEYVKKENPKMSPLLENGTIVLTGIKQREGLWAYEKNAPEKGGWVITQSGQRKVTAEEFRQLKGK